MSVLYTNNYYQVQGRALYFCGVHCTSSRACRSDGELMGCVRESGFNGRCRDGFTHFSIQFSSTVLLCTPLVSLMIFAKLLTYLVLYFWNCNAVRYTTSACAVLAIVGKWCLCESSADGQLLLKHN